MANTKLTRTNGTSTSLKKWTWSAWIKRGIVGTQETFVVTRYDDNNYSRIRTDPDVLQFEDRFSSTTYTDIKSTEVFRDLNAWYHIVVRIDYTQVNAADRARMYVNGTEVTYATTTRQSQDGNSYFNDATNHALGHYNDNNYFNGCMSHVHFTDGYSYGPDTFGSTDATTGEWKINTSPSVTYGNNGYFVLKDANGVTDQSGNSNNFTVGSGTLTQTEDNPSNNFCTLNALQRSRMNSNNSGDYLINNKNTFDTSSSNNITAIVNGTIGVSSGKWYWESKIITNARMQVGISTGIEQKFPQAYYDETEYSAMTMNLNGTFGGRYTGSAVDEFSTGTANTTNDILGFALDMDNKALYIHKNGTYLSNGSAVGVPTSGSSRTGSMIEGLTGSRDDYMPDGEFIFPVVMDLSTSGVAKLEFNFGNGYFGTTQISSEGTNASNIGKFEYDVPTGYTALSTKGLNE